MPTKQNYLKLIGLWSGGLRIHYAYDFFPIPFLKVFSGINESFFQHAKVTFVTYALINLFEYALRRSTIPNLESFVFSRLFTTTMLPWFIFILWFTGPAYFGQIPNVVVEIAFANIALITSGLFAIIIENGIEKIPFNKAQKLAISVLFMIALSQFIIFTYRLPWVDVFAVPPGW